MPARKSWLLRVREIREDLEALQVPVVDRSMFERLFGVRRRRAIQLMGFFGGFQAGRTSLVERSELVRQLEPIEASAEFAIEERRRQRLIESLEQVRRDRIAAQVSIPIQPLTGNVTDLPEGICLVPGRLQVTFQGAEDLVSKLYNLSQTALADFEAFRAKVCAAG